MAKGEDERTQWAASRRVVLGGALGLGATSGVQAAVQVEAKAFDGRLRGYSPTNRGVTLHLTHADVDLDFSTEGVISVTKAAPGALADHPSLFAPSAPVNSQVKIRDLADRLDLTLNGLRVRVAKGDGALSFADHTGAHLAETTSPAVRRRLQDGLEAYLGQAFDIGPDDALYGLGQFSQPFFNYRDKRVFLAHANYDTCNPVLVSTGGWGLFWDTKTTGYFTSKGDSVGFCTTNPAFLRYWQSKERYASQDELTGVVDEYRRRGAPLDNMVLDWAYWGSNDLFSGMVWDPAHFPDPAAMADHVHAQHAHMIVSIWPAFGPKSDIYKAMEAEGLLFSGPHWSGGRVYDASSPRARDIYWRYVKAALLDKGMDGFWTDGIEPEFMATGDRYGTAASFAANGQEAAGPIKDNLLTFSYYQSEGLYDHMRRDAPAKRPFLLTRKAYGGQQAFAATTWSGDIFASWGTLSSQIKAGLNFCLSGIPYWTDDIGGFLVTHRFPDGLSDPAYRELYVRWFQFGAFMPIFRAHGTQVPREIWRFGAPGDEAYDALLAALNLRYALMPYIYTQGAAVTRGHATIMRALVMDFPHDRIAQGVGDQFLFGRDLMVKVIDRPYFHAPADIQEFVPNFAVTGREGEPAARVTFFEGDQFERQVSQRLTDELKMTWFGDLPQALRGKPYSVRWTGRLVAPETGDYGLVFMGKGSLRLTLAGAVVFDHDDTSSARNDGANGGVAFKGHDGDWRGEASVRLTAGEAAEFELIQRQPNPDVVSTWIEWITPSQRQKMSPPTDKSVQVYVPQGRWYDWRTHQAYQGPGFHAFEVRLTDHPVLARAGAIIPTTPGIQYAQQPVDALHVKVFTGADGAFELYEDAGDGHDYQGGVFALTPMVWDDRTRTFRLGARRGGYRPVGGARTVTVELIGMEGEALTKTLSYDGEATSIRWVA